MITVNSNWLKPWNIESSDHFRFWNSCLLRSQSCTPPRGFSSPAASRPRPGDTVTGNDGNDGNDGCFLAHHSLTNSLEISDILGWSWAIFWLFVICFWGRFGCHLKMLEIICQNKIEITPKKAISTWTLREQGYLWFACAGCGLFVVSFWISKADRKDVTGGSSPKNPHKWCFFPIKMMSPNVAFYSTATWHGQVHQQTFYTWLGQYLPARAGTWEFAASQKTSTKWHCEHHGTMFMVSKWSKTLTF